MSRALPGQPQVVKDATTLAVELDHRFREQVHRSLGFDLDGSAISLAYVDHYLTQARDEDRVPILQLIAAGAGAYFGELVRREIGGTWIVQGNDPRNLRLLLEPQFLYFAPVDQAYEAVLAYEPDADDDRAPEGAPLDAAFRARPTPVASVDAATAQADGEGLDPPDHDWLMDRLAERPPVPEDVYYSLTGRYETLLLLLELLATKHLSEGREPRTYGLADYASVLADGHAHDAD